jgi:hypothetical protein
MSRDSKKKLIGVIILLIYLKFYSCYSLFRLCLAKIADG